jgi:hypothetical protein
LARTTLSAAVSGVTAAALAVVVASSAHADTAIYVDGMTNSVPDAVAQLLVPTGYKIERLDYPGGAWPVTGLSSDTVGQSIAVGVPALDNMIHAAVAAGDGPVVVTGVSLGAMVVEQEMRNLASQSDAPSASQVSFVLLADPTDRGGLFSYLPYTTVPILDMVMQPFPKTRYNVVVIRQLYDGVSSFPDRPWHLVADVNALFGFFTFHTSDHLANSFKLVENGQFPPAGTTTEVNSLGGTTTTYTGEVGGPSLTHLLDPFAPKLFAIVNRLITPIIDLGYSSKTPNAGPHFAPGGALVNKDGRPVFRVGQAQGPSEQRTMKMDPVETAHSDFSHAPAEVGSELKRGRSST